MFILYKDTIQKKVIAGKKKDVWLFHGPRVWDVKEWRMCQAVFLVDTKCCLQSYWAFHHIQDQRSWYMTMKYRFWLNVNMLNQPTAFYDSCLLYRNGIPYVYQFLTKCACKHIWRSSEIKLSCVKLHLFFCLFLVLFVCFVCLFVFLFFSFVTGWRIRPEWKHITILVFTT